MCERPLAFVLDLEAECPGADYSVSPVQTINLPRVPDSLPACQ